MPKSIKRSSTAKKPPNANARPPRATYEFTLVYPGYLDDLTDADIDALYEAGCDDALVASSEGEITIDFGRVATSYRVALASAISDVEKAGLGLELIRVEPIID